MSRVWAICVTVTAAALALGGRALAEGQKSAAELLPASTVFYVQVSHPKDVIAMLLDHPLRSDIEQSAAFTQALNSPKFMQFRAVLGVVEQKTGMSWRKMLETATGDGLAAAFDPGTQGIVVLLKPDDPAAARRLRDAVFSLPRQDAANKGLPDPIQTKTYRGLTAHVAGDATVAELGPWMMLSNKPALARKVADAYLDGGKALASDSEFTQAREHDAANGAPPGVWAFLRMSAVRKIAAGNALLDEKAKSENFPAELLLGGLIPVLQKTPYLTASLWLDRTDAKLRIQSPSDPSWVPEQRKFYFGGPGDGAARPLVPHDALLTLSTYRDLSALWQSAPDLFTEAIATQMAQADSTLSTIFGGRNFSTDVLGAIKPQMQLVVARQDFKAAGVAQPAIRLPAAALVLRVKGEQFAAVRRHFRVGFQSVVTFVNLDGATKGRPLLEMQSEKRSGAEILFATYGIADDDAKGQKPAPQTRPAAQDLYLNFSPALVLSQDHMILCSSKQLAEELADLAAHQADRSTLGQNTVIEINAGTAAKLIADNREQLIAQNMLKKGLDHAAAQDQIDLLQKIVAYFKDAQVDLAPEKDSVHLDVELKAAHQ